MAVPASVPTIDAPAPATGLVAGIPATARLHVVTGKGGTGKTTVAAALALAISALGRRVLLVEVEGRQALAQLFDVPALPYAEQRLASAPRRRPAVGPGHRRRAGDDRVPGHVLRSQALRARAEAHGRRRLRHHARARPARRPAHRQGQGGGGPDRRAGRAPLRRGGARRAADRADPPVPRRDPRGRQPDQVRADQPAERRRHQAAARRRGPRCTWSPCSRRCRSRRRSTPPPSSPRAGFHARRDRGQPGTSDADRRRPGCGPTAVSTPSCSPPACARRAFRRRTPRRSRSEMADYAERQRLQAENSARLDVLDLPRDRAARPEPAGRAGRAERARRAASRP